LFVDLAGLRPFQDTNKVFGIKGFSPSRNLAGYERLLLKPLNLEVERWCTSLLVSPLVRDFFEHLEDL